MDASQVYVRAWALDYCHSLISTQKYPNLSEGADRVCGQLRGDKECPFSGVNSSGRVWRKVPESDARSVRKVPESDARSVGTDKTESYLAPKHASTRGWGGGGGRIPPRFK